MKRVKPLLLVGLFIISQVAFSLGVLSQPVKAVTYPNVVKVSGGMSGAESNGDTTYSALSADGTSVAFQSHASNLVTGDTNGMMDVFVRNLSTNAVERVSLNNSGQQVTANSSFTDRIGSDPTISQDGRLVTFGSSVPALTGKPSFNYQNQVFLRDRQAGTTRIVSSDVNGVVANNRSNFGKLSANGQWVAFYSEASNLVPSDTNGRVDLFIKNLATGAVELVSVSSNGTQGNFDTDYNQSDGLDISPDGRYVLFASTASNLVASDPNGNTVDVFLRDRQTGTTERFAPTDCATMGSTYAGGAISDDGRWVAFSAYQCTQGTAGKVTLLDRQTSTLTVVNGMDNATDFSADGRYLLADNSNIFRYDRTTNINTPYVPNAQGGTMSATGNSFSYFAQDVYSQYPVGPKPGDTNQLNDAFVYQFAAEPIPTYTFSGILKDQAGNPIRGKVTLFNDNGTFTSGLNDQTTGAFSLTAPLGQYKLIADAQIGLKGKFETTGVAVNLTSNLTQDLVVNHVKFKFKILYPDGSPVAGAEVGIDQDLDSGNFTGTQLLPNQETWLKGGIHRSMVFTDSNGIAAVDVLANAPITTAWFPMIAGYAPLSTLTNLPAITQDMTDQEAIVRQLERKFIYSGTLKDQAGNPVSGKVLLIGGMGVYSVDTDPGTGAFSIAAPRGQYKLQAKLGPNKGRLTTVLETVDLTNDSNQNLVINKVKLKYKIVFPNGTSAVDLQVGADQVPSSEKTIQFLPNIEAVLDQMHRSMVPTDDNGIAALEVFPGIPASSVFFSVPGGYEPLSVLSNVPAITQDVTDEAAVVRQLVPSDVPAVPLNMAAASPTKVSPVLSWNAIPAASSFKIFRDGTEINTSTSPEFTDNSLTTSGAYTYKVSACNSVGCSAQSAAVTVAYDTDGPVLGAASWSSSPATEGQPTTLTVPVSDTPAGVASGEYYEGNDPGQGNGTAMTLASGNLSTALNLPIGTHTIKVRAKDAVGNWSATSSFDITVNNDAISVISGQVKGFGDEQPLAGVTVEVFDHNTHALVTTTTTNAGGNYSVTVDAAAYDMVFTPPANSGYGADGLGLIDARFGDQVVNDTLSLSQVSGFTAATPTNTPPVLNWSLHPLATYYEIHRPGPGLLGSTTGTTFTHISPPANSSQTYQIRACNTFGCGPFSEFLVVKYDTQAPLLGTPTWTVNPVYEDNDSIVSVSFSDTLTTVTQAEYYIGTDPGQGNGTPMTVGSGNVSATLGANLDIGIYTLHIRAKDAAGNWSTTSATDLTVRSADVTPPVVTYALTTPPNAAGWHKAPVTLTWTVSDAESALSNQFGCSQATVNTNGSYTYMCSATSAGGTTNQSVTIKYDATAPVVGHTLSTPANANGWHKADVTINWQATDSGSGSPTDPANIVATTQAANVTYTSGQSCDLAGNCATGTAQVSLDKVVPTQSNFTPAMLFMVVGSQNFSTAATDALSGVHRVEYYFDTDPGQGSGTAATHTTGNTYTGVIDTGTGNFFTPHNFFLRTQDKAGNWSTTLTRNYSELF